ncbi:GntR family transcriptional regulator [Tunturibacter empetritectus]|uniref:GntR family transcriptional regulator n=2 Tax=Tunturiibacter TaxID=3154218 RepID=A0A852VJ03_9BACT|nr:GntR family transcriptional regulator [Edaphobacter lichenicola]NYF91600.1 GntR family transcriptional regulator [Edaphobacter lichenicola]
MVVKVDQRDAYVWSTFASRHCEHMTTTPSQTASAVRSLDKNGFVPLYYQIQRALIEKIHSGELRKGDLLASEGELARAYQVSRVTARQALQGLKARGYAFSQRGRGTFVTKSKVEEQLSQLQGFTEETMQRGRVPSSRVLEQRVVDADNELAEDLEVQIGAPVMILRRLRLADGTPMAVEKTYVSLRHFPGIELTNFAEQSLYHTLREQFGVRVAWAAEAIEVMPATWEESELLDVPANTSVLSISRNTITAERMPIEVTVSRYRGDRYRALIRIPAATLPTSERIHEEKCFV